MPDAAAELKAYRCAAARTFEKLSSSLAGAPRDGQAALLRRCFLFLPILDKVDDGLAYRFRLRLLDYLRGVLSRDPSPSLLPAIEVFIENLVSRGPKWFFVKGDSAAPEGSRAFTVAQPFCGQHPTVLELACNHFISSLEDEGGFRAFIRALSWSGNESQGAPEICFGGAFALINQTRSFSLPGAVQAHLLLLASRCVSDPDPNLHLLTLEHCMNLYVDCLPALGVFNRTGGVIALDVFNRTRKKPLTCFIKGVTHQKLENRVNKLLSFCQAHVGDDLPISDSDIYVISDRLIDENQHMLHGSFRQEASTVIRSILSKVLHCAKQKECDAEITEDVIYLAAVLRLMGSLLAQILHHFSQMRAADDKGNASNAAFRGDFNILCDTIRLLSHYEENELHRCDFIGTIGQHVDRKRASIKMLAHFASLSVFSIRRRLGFLWRVCIIMMMMTMNLVILEEENMDMFQLCIDASKESADIPDTDNGNLTLALIPETDNRNLQVQVYVRRRTSKVIALQMGALKNRSTEKVNGLPFIQCQPDYKPSWNDLADFFECEEGKDYSNSLDQLKKFKNFKIKKFISKEKSAKKRRRDDMLMLSF